jgi:hypothetical protein
LISGFFSPYFMFPIEEEIGTREELNADKEMKEK